MRLAVRLKSAGAAVIGQGSGSDPDRDNVVAGSRLQDETLRSHW